MDDIVSAVERRTLELGERGITWYRTVDAPVTLSEDVAQKFKATAVDLSKEELLADRFSPETLEEKLRMVLESYLDDPQTGQEALQRQINDLDRFDDGQFVCVSVAGVQLDISQLDVGAVVFYPASSSGFSRITDHYEKRNEEEGLPQMTAEERELLSQQLCHHLGSPSDGASIATYFVVAEPRRAIQRALSEINRALDAVIFSWAGSVAYDEAADARPRVNQRPDGSLSTPISLSRSGLFFEKSSPPAHIPIVVNRQTQGVMVGNGLATLSDLLRKQRRTDLEEAIIRAAHWVSSAQEQVELENRLLNLVTALEVLLSPSNQQSLSQSISEATALLILDDIEKRSDMKKLITDFYGKRSKVSHGSKKGKVIELSEVRHLRLIVLQVIQEVMRWKDHLEEASPTGLQTWLNQAKLDSLRITPDRRKSLQNLRRLAGWEQGDVAKSLGVSADDVHRWEHDCPSFDEFDRLVELYRVSKNEVDFPGRFTYLEVRDREFFLRLIESSFGWWTAEVASIRTDVASAIAFPKRTERMSTRSAAVDAIREAILKAVALAGEVETAGQVSMGDDHSSSP